MKLAPKGWEQKVALTAQRYKDGHEHAGTKVETKHLDGEPVRCRLCDWCGAWIPERTR